MASYATCSEVGPLCPVELTTYGYYPNFAGNIFFIVFFGLLGICQTGLGLYYRTWTFLTALLIGTFMEMAGYIGRVLMHDNPWSGPAFKLQIVCLVLAPTFVAAGPRLFTWIFIGCDIGSLVLQAAGGGVAAAAGHTDFEMLKAGDNIIIAGIAFQVATMAVCGFFAVVFFWRVFKRGDGFSGEKNLDVSPIVPKWMPFVVGAEVFAYFTVLTRCIYRIPEMAGGWGNPLMQKENEFLVLDGMMIALACLAFTIFHPGVFLPSLRFAPKNRA
ncbi:hypothetical protein N7519_004829 [Penicillium mononematosum]|uniref:uncharacterized protein n=1 Tax=Penicillium mononematosum TaxID=268346 RepID=UPI0025465BE3|nr:uncharacterized protein N7519_004829 [Penicillium mononematosum]KAJ6189921.1 hypothetical protein N7519_004829 [Penicillium mononematosum]